MAKAKHIHKYERRRLGNYIIFKCMIPGCVNYIRKELADGRISICWRCGEPFVMAKATLELKRVHCVDCTKFKKPRSHDRLKELLNSDDMLSKVRA
jgi:hypothetical protein